MKRLLFVLLFALVFSVSTVFAASNVTFEWDANTETDLAGYRLYQSNTPGSYTFGVGNQVASIPVGTETVMVQVADGIWYWVLTAYDTGGRESGPSNEVTAALDTTPPSAPGGLRITVVVTIENP